MKTNKEQIIDEVYENYKKEMLYHPEENWLDNGVGEKSYRQPSKELFLFEIKNNLEFSEKWGLKIEERELSLEERIVIKNSKNIFISKGYIDDNGHLNDIGRLKLDKLIPTKLITLTYNNEKIESYD